MTRVPEDPERSAAHATFALVIPTHRRPDLVVQAVESALRQTRPFDQVVVVADGLDDPAVAVLDASPVEVVAIEKAGVAAARNAGVDRARTDWVCFLDDDDLLHPDYLSRVEAETIDAPQIGAMNAAYWSFAEVAGPGDEFSASTLDGCHVADRSAAAKPQATPTSVTPKRRSFAPRPRARPIPPNCTPTHRRRTGDPMPPSRARRTTWFRRPYSL